MRINLGLEIGYLLQRYRAGRAPGSNSPKEEAAEEAAVVCMGGLRSYDKSSVRILWGIL